VLSLVLPYCHAYRAHPAHPPLRHLLVDCCQVADLEDVAVADIAAGGWHSMALSADGQIYVWGR